MESAPTYATLQYLTFRLDRELFAIDIVHSR
jgi:chemotaxis signal transduction protein